MNCFRSLTVAAILILQLVLLLQVSAKDKDDSLPVDPNIMIPVTGIRGIKAGQCLAIPLFSGLFYYLNQVGQMRRAVPYMMYYGKIKGSDNTDKKMLVQATMAIVNSESPDPCDDFRSQGYIPQSLMIGEYPLALNMSVVVNNLMTNLKTNQLGAAVLLTKG